MAVRCFLFQSCLFALALFLIKFNNYFELHFVFNDSENVFELKFVFSVSAALLLLCVVRALCTNDSRTGEVRAVLTEKIIYFLNVLFSRCCRTSALTHSK